MQCPYCGKEMELGLVQSIVLSPLNIKNMITGCAVRAFLCRSCKKVIIDYSDES